MQILYKVPKTYESDLYKYEQELRNYENNFENMNSFKRLFADYKPPYSETVLKQNIDTYKTVDLLFNSDTSNVKLVPDKNSLKYELEFDSVLLKTQTKHNSLEFTSLVLNSDYEDITMIIHVDPNTNELELMLMFPRDYVSMYRRHEVINIETPINIVD